MLQTGRERNPGAYSEEKLRVMTVKTIRGACEVVTDLKI